MNKKVLLTFSLLVLFVFHVKAQQLERSVINATGGSFVSSQVLLDANVGELMSNTLIKNEQILIQGFLQPSIATTTGLEELYKKLNFKYYPNPTNLSLTLDSEAHQNIQQVVFYDGVGKLVLQINFNTTLLDVSSFAPGFYSVQALDKRNIPIHTFKLIKQ